MSAVLKIIAGFFALLLLAVGSLVATWVMSDHSEWRDYLTRLASQKLGRELVIAGPLEPSFSFTQGLTIKVQDLSLANADGYQPREMLSVPELEIAVDLRALFSKNIHITGVVLNGATLNLELRTGGNNWNFNEKNKTQPQEEEPAVTAKDGKVVAFAADDITASDLVINVKSNSVARQLKFNSLAIKAPADDRFELTTDATVDGTALKAAIKAGTLSEFSRGVKQQLDADITYGGKQVALASTYSRHQNSQQFDNFTLVFDKLTVTGTSSIDASGAVPSIKAALAATQIDIAWFGSDDEGSASSNKSQQKADAPLFSAAPLPWDLLTVANLDLRFDAKQILQQGKPWGPGHVQAQLANGSLASTVIIQPPGAAQPVKINMGASTAQRLNLAVDAPQLDAVLWARFLGDDPFILSPAAIALNVAGQGASPKAIVASSNGALSFIAQPGKLKPTALPNTVRRVLDAVFTPAVVNEAALGCMQAKFNIQNGVMHSAGIGVDSNIASVSGEGNVSLAAEAIKMRFVAVPKIAAISSVRIPVTIDGPLASPGFGADAVATAGQVAGKVAGALLSARFGDFAGKAIDTASTQLVSLPPNPCVIAPPEQAPVDPATVRQGLKDIVPPNVVEDVEKARQKTLEFIQNPLEKLRGKRSPDGSGAVPSPTPVPETPATPAVPTTPPVAEVPAVPAPATEPAAEPAAPAP